MLLGTGHLLCVVSQQALVANTAARQRLDTSFGHYTFAASLGQALGPAAIVAFGRGGPIPDTHAVFVASALFSAVLTALSMGLQRLPARVSRASTDPTASVRTLLRLPGLLRALTTSCVILAAVDITLVYLPALGAERDLSVAVVGGLLGARAAASMVSRLFLGRLTARAGRRQVLVTSTAVAALGTAAVAVPMPLPVLTAVVILMGLGLGVGQPVTMAWLAETSPPGMRGRSMSLRLLGNRAGQLVVPSAMGLVAADLGSAGVLCGTAAALAGAAVTARNITQPGAAGAGEPT
jgi:MFS family permease